ncbi:putative glyoxalase [Bacillus sp. TS-2]|nr:putative glyoxalase [Bacillus sp. TS-2]
MEIQELTLQTTKLEEMKKFYGKQLGFSLIEDSYHHFKVQIGTSILEFTNEDVEGEPYYHFAFNVPGNQFEEAKKWLKDKTSLLWEDGKDEVNFSFWSAHACYFEDPAGNIVELIARTIENEMSEESFTSNSIINISEIGLAVENAANVGEILEKLGIVKSNQDLITNASLSFMQEYQNGVFLILVGEGRKWLFSKKQSKIFPLEIKLNQRRVIGVNNQKEFIYHSS